MTANLNQSKPSSHWRSALKKTSRISFVVIFSLTLNACSHTLIRTTADSLSPNPVNTSSTPAKPRSYLTQWQASGRILISYQKNGLPDEPPYSLPGSFEWRQSPLESNITLSSQLGQTLVEIVQNPQGASLQQPGRPILYADNLEDLLNDSLGWSLPVSGLRDWLQGFSRDEQGQLQALATQDNLSLTLNGWQVRYASWFREPVSNANDVAQHKGATVRPKRIDLARHTTATGDMQIRIIIDQWNEE